MYIGSVRFYKHLIYLVMFILAVLLMYSLFHVGCLIASAHAGGGTNLKIPVKWGFQSMQVNMIMITIQIREFHCFRMQNQMKINQRMYRKKQVLKKTE